MIAKPKFLGKYRIGSMRAQWWNYSNNGAYFITICTKDRKHFFGEIKDDRMILSACGIIARKCWNAIPEHFPFVKLGAFVVMPDHVHGIILIEKGLEDGRIVVCNDCASIKDQVMSEKSPKRGSLASIIRSYKSAASKFSRTENPNFAWQSKYHDSIIQDQNAFDNISRYIENNPKNWGRKISE